MYYLAYGSNLHPLRLTLRTSNARLIGTTSLNGYQLIFNKRSNDGSAKCNLSFTKNAADAAYGAIYDIPDAEIPLLDEFEGLGAGYDKHHIEVSVEKQNKISVFVYLASRSHLALNLEPYEWYKRLVLAGARWHQFPPEYIQQISNIICKQDHDDSRRNEMGNLLVQLEG